MVFATISSMLTRFGTMKNSKKKVSRKSVVHLAGFLRSGAGKHKDKKKAANKRACRGKVKW